MTRTTALLYWLTIICGLSAVTYLRIDEVDSLAPLWSGTLAGVALGQVVGWLRIRTWALVMAGVAVGWLVVTTSSLTSHFSSFDLESFFASFVPALICGRLSLSERGGLAALWYPAVLWMVVILGDGRHLDVRGSLPLLVGFGALFVAYLRARETRRVAIWLSEGHARIAAKPTCTVLRASPLRGAWDVAWSGGLGVGALLLVTWIAPHLWEKSHVVQTMAKPARWQLPGAQRPCCPANDEEVTRIDEYLPLLGARLEQTRRATLLNVCDSACSAEPIASAPGEEAAHATGLGRSARSMPSNPSRSPAEAWSDDLPSISSWLTPRASDDRAEAPAPDTRPVPRRHATESDGARPSTQARAGGLSQGASPHDPLAASGFASAPSPLFRGAPWKWMLGACVVFVLFQFATRALRRRLTLTHLRKPFWAETVDQRISNHWQRVLVGLRDAGIQPRAGESPAAFAKRVGIAGLETCATVLDRVRHGVRLGSGDLDEMHAAADEAYRAARSRVGILGRAASWLRWPLA